MITVIRWPYSIGPLSEVEELLANEAKGTQVGGAPSIKQLSHA